MASGISNKNVKFGLIWPLFHFETAHFKWALARSHMASFLHDLVGICRWQVYLGPFSNVNDRIMPMSDAVSFEGPKIQPCPLRPDILQTKSKNELIWHHFEQNQAETKFILSSFRQLDTTHRSKLSGEFILAPKHLWATIGLWWLRNRWVCSGTPHYLTRNIFPPVSFSFNKRSGRRTTSQSHQRCKEYLKTTLE